MIDKSKEHHSQSLAELQQELKSLKALLLSRGPGSVSGATTPVIPPKPTIPAWQLAGSNHFANGSSSSLPASPSASTTGPVPISSTGKGKEVQPPSP
jgi:peroxin-14